MYKVLVIEDEKIIREGLILAMPWLELGCEVVAQTGDGKEAFENIEKYKPDLLICDINIPFISGLDLIKQSIHKYKYETIIISGYSEFSYAQEAMKYGVQEYILKPVVHEDLIQAIRRITSKIDSRRLFDELLNGFNNELDIIKFTSDNELSWPVHKMIEYIKKNYGKKIIMEDMVHLIKQSSTSLHNSFKKETGYSFNQYLNRYRVQMVITKLVEDENQIQDIAMLCGFLDIKYFYKVFTKTTGHSPTEIKKIIELNIIKKHK